MFDPIYFWKGDQVCKYHGYSNAEHMERTEFLDCFAVDTACIEEMRYGMYKRKTGWIHVPIEQFPPEFRTHLLLLGVP